MRTPVSRVGNKTPILSTIYRLFPMQYRTYVDVFGGSGSVLFGKPTVDPVEVYNDYDSNLSNLFMCMKDRPLALMRELKFAHITSRAEFDAIKMFLQAEDLPQPYMDEEFALASEMFTEDMAEEIISLRMSKAEDHDVRRAAAYLKSLRMSYASMGSSYAAQPFNVERLCGLLQEAGRRLQTVIVENKDFECIIRHYDADDTFFYLDPPYLSTEGMYDVQFALEDHYRLRDLLHQIKGKFLLSYNDCDTVRGWYCSFPMFEFTRPHSMKQRYDAGSLFPELLIGNYDIYEKMRTQPAQMNLFENYEEGGNPQ